MIIKPHYADCSGDLIEKVQWARAHDDLSRAIVSWLMGIEKIRRVKRDTMKMYIRGFEDDMFLSVYIHPNTIQSTDMIYMTYIYIYSLIYIYIYICIHPVI